MKTSKPSLIKFRGAVYRLADSWPPVEEDLESNVPRAGQELNRSQQIALLKSGVKAWNQWRGSQSPFQPAQLQEADLQGADLQGADLQGADLQHAALRGADLRGADLQWANLRGANLVRVNLIGANLQGADLYAVDLYRARYDDYTKFPQGFDPEAAGMILR